MLSKRPDTCVPVGCLDACGGAPDVLLVFGWVLDGTLNPDTLGTAWTDLNRTWPILASRLRINKAKNMEFHVADPSCVSPGYKHVREPGSLAAHVDYPVHSPIAQLKKKSLQHDLFSDPSRRLVKDLLKKDLPICALQLTSFDDGSIVGFSVPHVFVDGQGAKEIIDALLRVLRGEEVAPLESHDPFLPYAQSVDPVAPPGWRVLSILEAILLMVFVLWDAVRYYPSKRYDIFLPQKDVEDIKRRAMEDLQVEKADDKMASRISTSDALLAFMLKCMHPTGRDRSPVNIVYPANLRKYIPSTIPRVYLRNAFNEIILSFPTRDIQSRSLGALALQIRTTLRAQTTPEAIERFLRWRIAARGKLAMFTSPAGTWDSSSNWRDMKFMYVDFSPAAREPDATVRCVYMWSHLYSPYPVRHTVFIGHDDPRGGIWLQTDLHRPILDVKEGLRRFI